MDTCDGRPSWPIARQLRLEEALLRHDSRNWCVVNFLAPGTAPTVVVGLGGKAETLVRLDAAAAHGVPVVRRFTGGGTVVVAAGTVFTSVLLNKASHQFPMCALS